MRQMLRSTFLGLVFVAAGCATRTPYNPFKVSRETFFGHTKTIAMTPFMLPSDLENPEPVRTEFESLIEAKLRSAGFSVVASGDYADIWKRVTEQMGGYFDPVTGKQDEAKFKAAQEHARREIATKSSADALVHAGFTVVGAAFASGTAQWNGTSEPVGTGGFWAQLLGNLGGLQGKIPALSLLVIIEDVNGAEEYANAGGVQLLSKVSYGKFVPVPRDALFADKARNAAAVSIALDPLLTTTGTDSK